MRISMWLGVLPAVFAFSMSVYGGVVPTTGFVLVDTMGTPIEIIEDGDVFDVDSFPTSLFTIQALFDNDVESVLFGLDGNPNFRIENVAPYVISGDFVGVFFPLSLSLGTHTVTATPYPLDGLGGIPGPVVSATFTLVSNGGDPVNPPSIVSSPPTTATVGTTLTYMLEVTDPDDGETFTFDVLDGPGSIDALGVYTYTPDLSDLGPVTIELEVTDSDNISVSQTFTLFVVENVARALVQVTADAGSLIFTSTFTSDTIKVLNTSTGGQKIVSFSLDLSTTVYPDVLFDPLDGTPAGDVGANCFTPNPADAAATGLIEPMDPCADPFSAPSENGYQVISLLFNDFEPGLTQAFGIDIDPSSIQNADVGGFGGEISGVEMAGATVTVVFDDGTTQTGQLAYISGSFAGSEVTTKETPQLAPLLEIGGVVDMAMTSDETPTATVSGPVGAEVTLIVMESILDLPDLGGMPNPGFDIEPFETNTAVFLDEYFGTIGGSGIVSIPFTFAESMDENGSLYVIYAVTRDSANPDLSCSSLVSNVVTLDFVPPLPPGAPMFTSMPPLSAVVGEELTYQAVAEDPDMDPILFLAPNGIPFAMESFDVTGLLTVTPQPGEEGFQTVTLRALDTNQGLFVDQVFTICVSGPMSQPPVITSVDPMAVLEAGETFDFKVQATDPDPCDTVSFVFDLLPLGAVGDETSGEITFTPTMISGSSEVFDFEVTAVDDKGTSSDPFVFSVIVVEPIEKLILVDADTNLDVFTLLDGQTYNVDDPGFPASYSIRAEFPNPLVESVLFGLDGNSFFQVESVAPYALAGDTAGDFKAIDLGLGTHTVTATPFSGNGASGMAGTPLTATFQLVAGGIPADPMITSMAPMGVVRIGNTFEYQLEVADANLPAETFMYDVMSGPGAIDAMGLYTFTPDMSDSGNMISVTVEVTDSTGLTDTQSFMIEVTAEQFPPVIVSAPGLLELRLSAFVSVPFTIEADDPNGDNSALMWELVPPFPFATFGFTDGAVTNANFDFDPFNTPPGPGSATVRVTDEEGLSADIVIEYCVYPEMDTPPTITNAPPMVVEVNEGDVFEFDFDGEDVDACDSGLLFLLDAMPAGASLDENTGVFTFDSSISGLGTFLIEVVAESETLEGFVFSLPVVFEIEVVEPVERLILVDSVTDLDIGPLADGATIIVDELPNGEDFTVRADFGTEPVGSVIFSLDGISIFRIENVAPYVISGDINGNTATLDLSIGMHTIVATPYSGPNGTGTAGTPLVSTFTLISMN